MKIVRIPLVVVLVAAGGWAFNASALTELNLHDFVGSPTDGAFPYAGLVPGSDGNLYGTTDAGGTNACACGTVFRVSPSGNYTNLYSFAGSPADGANPVAGLVQGSNGFFYGTASAGGTNNDGTVFRISPGGGYTNLYSFVGSPNDGANPNAALVLGSDGNLYGTADAGGTNACSCGTVFRVSPSGNYTNLYSFAGAPTDGDTPYAGPVRGSDGNLYGTTFYGGTNDAGTVFRVSPGGSYTTLYSFASSPSDGAYPYAGLVQGSDGNFYGTTSEGGTNLCSCGTLFRISPRGSYSSLYSFAGSPTDGDTPYAGLVQGGDGNFYGTTQNGGTSTNCLGGCGTIFRVSPSGSYTSLYSFVGYPTDGSSPEIAPVVGSDGSIYATTFFGGTNNDGTVFKLGVSLDSPPFPINQITNAQMVATNMIFTIPTIAGETYQLQYRTSLTTGSWSNVPGVSVTNSIGSVLTLTNFGGAVGPQKFYRFAITP